MDATIERECSALGGLFQQIITDMKVSNVDAISTRYLFSEATAFFAVHHFCMLRIFAQVMMQAKTHCRCTVSLTQIS